MRAGLAGASFLALGLAAGIGLALVSMAMSVALGWAPGHPLEVAFWSHPRGWFDAVVAGLFGWAIGGAAALVAGARRDLEALRPVLVPGTPLPAMDVFPSGALCGAAIAGVLLGVVVNLVPANWPEGFPGLTDPFLVWATLRTCLVAWALGRVGVIAATLSGRFSRLGPAIQVGDLLDLRALAPLGREALRHVAVWVGISAFFAVMLMAPFGRPVTLVSMCVSGAVGVLAFLGPVRGARRRLRELREAERLRVRAALAARLAGKPPPEARWLDLSLGDLLAWEERVERVRTWPFDASMLVRFALYVLIGLGSWIGAALVERALGAALG